MALSVEFALVLGPAAERIRKACEQHQDILTSLTVTLVVGYCPYLADDEVYLPPPIIVLPGVPHLSPMGRYLLPTSLSLLRGLGCVEDNI